MRAVFQKKVNGRSWIDQLGHGGFQIRVQLGLTVDVGHSRPLGDAHLLIMEILDAQKGNWNGENYQNVSELVCQVNGRDTEQSR